MGFNSGRFTMSERSLSPIKLTRFALLVLFIKRDQVNHKKYASPTGFTWNGKIALNNTQLKIKEE